MIDGTAMFSKLPATLVVLMLCVSTFAGETRTLTTRYYRIRSDLDPALTQDLATRLDAMYEEYERRLADFDYGGPKLTLNVHLFERRADYTRFTDNRVPNSGGVFSPGKNALATFLESQGRDAMRRTLQHEAFHQFAHTRIAPHMPVWLNEGLAVVFEEGLWTGERFILGQVPPRRLRLLQKDMRDRRLVPFRKMLSLTPSQWEDAMRGGPETSATYYNQAWAMTHYLIYGTDASGSPLRPRLIEMLRLLHLGRDGDSAFREAFSDNIKGFQDRFVDYAHALKATPEATLIENHEILADMLIHLATKGRRFDDIAHFRQLVCDNRFQLTYDRDHVRWKSAADPTVYFRDLQGRAYPESVLYFDHRGAALRDLVVRTDHRFNLRARFHPLPNGQFEREILLEPSR
jgi:hypothetical protein